MPIKQGLRSMRGQCCAVLMAFWLLGCAGAAQPTVAPHITRTQQARAAASMGLAFPSTPRFLLYRRALEGPSLMFGPDDAIQLKIELPAAAAAAFLAARPLSEARWDTAVSQVHDVPDWPDWRPSRVRMFRSTQIALPEGEFLNVLVDEDDPEQVTVYLEWFQT